MRELYHYPIDPFGRLARIYLKEKAIDHTTIVETPWQRKHTFSEMHTESDLPTLVDMDGTTLAGWYPIIEHCEQVYRSSPLIGVSLKEKAEVRRLLAFFNVMFFSEVVINIVFEKVLKRFMYNTSPDSARIRSGGAALAKYFDHIAWLTNRRNWLAGDDFSLADIAASAHISCIDYVGSIEWKKYPEVQDWYVRIKSRPSFRDILSDRVSHIAPPAYYSELDF